MFLVQKKLLALSLCIAYAPALMADTHETQLKTEWRSLDDKGRIALSKRVASDLLKKRNEELHNEKVALARKKITALVSAAQDSDVKSEEFEVDELFIKSPFYGYKLPKRDGYNVHFTRAAHSVLNRRFAPTDESYAAEGFTESTPSAPLEIPVTTENVSKSFAQDRCFRLLDSVRTATALFMDTFLAESIRPFNLAKTETLWANISVAKSSFAMKPLNAGALPLDFYKFSSFDQFSERPVSLARNDDKYNYEVKEDNGVPAFAGARHTQEICERVLFIAQPNNFPVTTDPILEAKLFRENIIKFRKVFEANSSTKDPVELSMRAEVSKLSDLANEAFFELLVMRLLGWI